MWPPSQQPIRWTLIGKTICMLFFFTFWSYQLNFLFGVYAEDPDMDPEWSTWWYINTKHHHQPCLIFFDVFSIYFYCPYIWHNLTFYIWKYTLDPENTTQHHYQPSLLFSDFFYIFTVFPFSTTHLPYMEIYNGPWEHHLMSSPTISIFFWFFSIYFRCFSI